MIVFNKKFHTQALADYLPNGYMFESKNINDSNFRALLRGLAGELFTAQGYLITFEEEYIPDNTNLFLSEWEKALAIPDDCLNGAGTNNERRRDILIKLALMGIQTADNFVQFANLFGISITVTPGVEVFSFPVEFPIFFFNSPLDTRYVIVIDFSLGDSGFFIYDFPIIFGNKTQEILKCLFNKLKPANCRLVFRSVQ